MYAKIPRELDDQSRTNSFERVNDNDRFEDIGSRKIRIKEDELSTSTMIFFSGDHFGELF